VVTFKSTDEVVVGGEKIKRTSVEAKQKLVFNDTLLKVTDENAKAGLDYKWDFGEGEDVYIQYNVKPQDAPLAHTYDVAGVYTIILQVVDDINNVGEAKLIVDVTAPIGVTGKIIDIKRDQEDFKEKNTIQRNGWIAYKILEVKNGDKITIKFTVEPKPGIEDLGLRVFVIPEKNFKVYQENKPTTKVISRKYEKYWSSPVGETRIVGEIEINAEEDDTIMIIFDNRHYEEGKIHLSVDEPAEYTVTIQREESPVFLILIIVVLIVVILGAIIGVFLYMKTKRSSGVTKITKEAAIETQRSLDREMAELELEIQDSLRRQTIAAPMSAMPLQKQAPKPTGGQPAAAAPGTVPRTPAPVGATPAGGAQRGLTPGATPFLMIRRPPRSTPGDQKMLPTGSAGAPQQAGAPGQTPSTAQPQMLPPAPKTAAQPQAQPQQPPPPQQPAQPQTPPPQQQQAKAIQPPPEG
jgi:hypothetical protein